MVPLLSQKGGAPRATPHLQETTLAVSFTSYEQAAPTTGDVESVMRKILPDPLLAEMQ